MTAPLTESDFEQAAAIIGCDVAAIKAVREVLALKAAFLPDTRPVITFERTKFHQFTHGQHDDYSEISSDQPGGYRSGSLDEYTRYYLAVRFDESAAKMSTRWGRYQLPGWEYKHCGFDSVDDFVRAMNQSEREQLLAWAHFLTACRLDTYLKTQDWPGLVAHQKNLKPEMADRLREAYDRYAPLPQVIELVPPPRFTQRLAPPTVERSETATVEPVPVETITPFDPSRKVTRDGWKCLLVVLIAIASGAGSVYAGWERGDLWLSTLGAIVQIAVIVAMVYRWTVLDRERLRIAANPRRFNVQ